MSDDIQPQGDERSYQKRTADREQMLKDAKADYKRYEEYWKDNRTAYVEDQKFLGGEHWPQTVKRDRERDGRPVLVVDKLNQYRRQVTNDARLNRPQPKVFPVADSGGQDDVAEAFMGIIRNIWSRSNADEATDWALDCAVSGGFGFVRILTEYVGDDSFNQDIRIQRVRNPLTVLLDPNHRESDGSDCKGAFITDEIPEADFKANYPKAKKTNWEDEKFGSGWYDREKKTVRVCEWFRVVEEDRELLLLEDNTVTDREEYDEYVAEVAKGGAKQPPPAIVRAEVRPVKRVKWAKLTGAEVLEESDWAGRYIPIVPVVGEERDIEGKRIYQSLVRPAKDAQRLYNFARSAFAERVALAPKAPWVAAVGQTEDLEEWRTANTGNHQVLRYNPVDVDGHPVAPPQRVMGADVPSGFMQDMQLSEHDIQGAVGMYNASLGERSNEKSGKAINARKQEGDIATFHFVDNLSRATRQIGRVLVDLIPEIYDSKRELRILGEDGEAEMAEHDPESPQPVMQMGEKTIYNLNIGRYDVDVKSGPSFTTKREEAVDAMTSLVQANPAIFGAIGDIMVRNMDWPGAEDIAKRLKAMLPPPIQQLEQADKSGIPAEAQGMLNNMMEQANQAIGQRDQQIQAMGQALQEAQNAVGQAQADLDAVKRQSSDAVDRANLDARQKVFDAKLAEANAQAALREAKLIDQVRKLVEQAAANGEAPDAAELDGVLGQVDGTTMDPGIEALVASFQNQMASLVAAINAPRSGIPERNPDGSIKRVISVAQPPAMPAMDAPVGVNPSVAALVSAFQEQTKALVGAILAPKIGIPERGPDGLVTRVMQAPEAIQ